MLYIDVTLSKQKQERLTFMEGDNYVNVVQGFSSKFNLCSMKQAKLIQIVRDHLTSMHTVEETDENY